MPFGGAEFAAAVAVSGAFVAVAVGGDEEVVAESVEDGGCAEAFGAVAAAAVDEDGPLVGGLGCGDVPGGDGSVDGVDFEVVVFESAGVGGVADEVVVVPAAGAWFDLAEVDVEEFAGDGFFVAGDAFADADVGSAVVEPDSGESGGGGVVVGGDGDGSGADGGDVEVVGGVFVEGDDAAGEVCGEGGGGGSCEGYCCGAGECAGGYYFGDPSAVVHGSIVPGLVTGW